MNTDTLISQWLKHYKSQTHSYIDKEKVIFSRDNPEIYGWWVKFEFEGQQDYCFVSIDELIEFGNTLTGVTAP